MMTMTTGQKRSVTTAGAVAALAVTLAGCGDPGASDTAGSGGGGGDAAGLVAGLETNEQLHDQLPADVRKSGELTSVMAGAFPPYTIPAEASTGFEGASIAMGDALGKVLGVEVTTQPVEGLSGVLNGLDSGRYDFAMGPIGDYEDRQAGADFIDWVQEFVAFLTPEGNPKGIKSIEDTCGLRIAVQAGGSAEEVIRAQSDDCKKNGDKAIEVQAFPDQPAATLAVKAGRSDAFFSSQAPLTYFATQDTEGLTVAAKGKPNDFDPIRQGSVFPEDSELLPVVYEAFHVLVENGTYDKIMKKWDLEDQMLDELTVNRKPFKS
jgi:polar amino acid transport system substrate-binding protein